MNVWVIIAIFYDVFNFGYDVNLFQKSSMLISSISIISGHSNYMVRELKKKYVAKKSNRFYC